MILKDENILKAIRSVKTQNRTVTVTQSCYDMIDAEQGKFSSPLTTQETTLEYKLEYRMNKSKKG